MIRAKASESSGRAVDVHGDTTDVSAADHRTVIG